MNIDVDDLARAEVFHTVAFGLRAGHGFGNHAIELPGAEAPLYLLAKSAGSAPHHDAAAAHDYGRTGRRCTSISRSMTPTRPCAPRLPRARWRKAMRARRPGAAARRLPTPGHGYCLIEFSARGHDAVADAG